MPIRGTYEGHDAVARGPVDGDACLHEPIASCVNIVDFIREMAEMARLAIVLGIPIICEFDFRPRTAGLLAFLDNFLVARRGQEHQGIAVLFVDPTPGFLEP